MGELRDLFEDGTGGFRPSADDALERTRQRAERRARNRRLIAASVALALAATTLSGLWAAFRSTPETPRPAGPGPTGDPVVVGALSDAPGWLLAGTPGYVWVAGEDLARIDLVTGRPEVLLEGRGQPHEGHVFARATLAFGSLWVTEPKPQLVHRLDADTGSVLATFELGDEGIDRFVPALIYPYRGFVRITDSESGATIDIDPRTAAIRPANDLPSESEAPAFEQASGGYLWTVTDDEVMALPPEADPSPFQRWPLVGTPVGLAVDESIAWVAVANAATGFHLYRYDLGRREVAELPHDGRPFHEMVYLDRRLWILGDGPYCDASVRGFDPRTGEQIGQTLLIRTANSGPSTGEDTGVCTAIGHFWTFISGGGFLWVQGGPDGLLQIDPNGVAETQEEPRGPCPPPDLETTFVPSGIEPSQAQPGMGGGADLDGQFPNVIHFGDSPGPDGRPAPFIEIFRTGPGGGPLLPEDHARRFGDPIEVLGGEGYLVSIEDGWGVWFEHGDGPCNGYELHAYGPTKAETRRFAEGLRPRAEPAPGPIQPTSPPADVGIPYPFESGHCGLGWVVDFDGSFWEPLPGVPEDLLISQSSGTMTLVGADEARFEAEDGRSARLRRLDGPFVPELCD